MVCVSEGYFQAFGSWTSFGSTIQCVVTIKAFMAGVVGMSVGSGFPVLSSPGWLVKYLQFHFKVLEVPVHLVSASTKVACCLYWLPQQV